MKQRESLTGTLSEEDYAKMEKKVIILLVSTKLLTSTKLLSTKLLTSFLGTTLLRMLLLLLTN